MLRRAKKKLARDGGGGVTSTSKFNARPAQAIEMPTQIGSYRLLKRIGKGAFGSVWSAISESGENIGRTVAVKMIEMTAHNDLDDVQMEIRLLQNLGHQNIVKYIDGIVAPHHLAIVLEYIESGQLCQLIKEMKTPPTERLIAHYAKQILAGLDYLHQQGVIHRDIKGANILTTKEGVVKLADFGLATKLSDSGRSHSVVGTPFWMAPEIITMNSAQSSACDIWSVGCTIVELLTGKPPYFDLNAMAAMYRIVQDTMPPLPQYISPGLKNFLSACFRKDPSVRATASELLQHKWIVEHTNNSSSSSSSSSSDAANAASSSSSSAESKSDMDARSALEPETFTVHGQQQLLERVAADTCTDQEWQWEFGGLMKYLRPDAEPAIVVRSCTGLVELLGKHPMKTRVGLLRHGLVALNAILTWEPPAEEGKEVKQSKKDKKDKKEKKDDEEARKSRQEVVACVIELLAKLLLQNLNFNVQRGPEHLYAKRKRNPLFSSFSSSSSSSSGSGESSEVSGGDPSSQARQAQPAEIPPPLSDEEFTAAMWAMLGGFQGGRFECADPVQLHVGEGFLAVGLLPVILKVAQGGVGITSDCRSNALAMALYFCFIDTKAFVSSGGLKCIVECFRVRYIGNNQRIVHLAVHAVYHLICCCKTNTVDLLELLCVNGLLGVLTQSLQSVHKLQKLSVALIQQNGGGNAGDSKESASVLIHDTISEKLSEDGGGSSVDMEVSKTTNNNATSSFRRSRSVRTRFSHGAHCVVVADTLDHTMGSLGIKEDSNYTLMIAWILGLLASCESTQIKVYFAQHGVLNTVFKVVRTNRCGMGATCLLLRSISHLVKDGITLTMFDGTKNKLPIAALPALMATLKRIDALYANPQQLAATSAIDRKLMESIEMYCLLSLKYLCIVHPDPLESIGLDALYAILVDTKRELSARTRTTDFVPLIVPILFRIANHSIHLRPTLVKSNLGLPFFASLMTKNRRYFSQTLDTISSWGQDEDIESVEDALMQQEVKAALLANMNEMTPTEALSVLRSCSKIFASSRFLGKNLGRSQEYLELLKELLNRNAANTNNIRVAILKLLDLLLRQQAQQPDHTLLAELGLTSLLSELARDQASVLVSGLAQVLMDHVLEVKDKTASIKNLSDTKKAFKSCVICGTKFSFFTRPHNCKQCRQVVCAGCSPHSAIIQENKRRICNDCYAENNKKHAREEQKSSFYA